jgi:hypothetical protein
MDQNTNISRFQSNLFLSDDKKNSLLSNEVILILPLGDINQRSIDIFDNCIIGAIENHRGNLVAVYHFERLVFAHWWDFSGQQGNEYDNRLDDFESDFGRFTSWENYIDDLEDEEDDMWYLQAYEFVSTQYIMNMYPHWSNEATGKYFMVAESNPDLVAEIDEGIQDGELTEINGTKYILHG